MIYKKNWSWPEWPKPGGGSTTRPGLKTLVILGIKISKTADELILFQYYYIEKILDKYFKGDNSIVKTLIDISVYLSNNTCKRINQL